MTTSARPGTGAGFVEVGDRCWVARYPYLDVNVGLVAGSRGLLVVDTQACDRLARQVLADLESLGAGPVVAVLNTHGHFDHTFGNATFRAAYPGVPIHAHEIAAANTGHPDEASGDGADDPYWPEVLATEVLPADHTFSSVAAVDLGGRLVELVHLGRGHTGGDVVARVPEAGVTFAGDLVEESASQGDVPGFGSDCYPLEWPATLDLLISTLAEGEVVVPGHGRPVGKGFVETQREAIGTVAEQVRQLAAAGVPVARALEEVDWPYPKAALRHAVTRGYEHLPRAARSLPLA